MTLNLCRMMMRFSSVALLFLPLAGQAAGADETRLVLETHVFTPSEIHLKANTPHVLRIHNADATAEEFDSADLSIEKVIASGKEGIVHLPPLKPGQYTFTGEYHASTAHGVLIAE